MTKDTFLCSLDIDNDGSHDILGIVGALPKSSTTHGTDLKKGLKIK